VAEDVLELPAYGVRDATEPGRLDLPGALVQPVMARSRDAVSHQHDRGDGAIPVRWRNAAASASA